MLTKPTGPFASDGEIASKMEEWGDALAARIAELEALLSGIKSCTRCPNPADQSLVHIAPGKVQEFSRIIRSIG